MLGRILEFVWRAGQPTKLSRTLFHATGRLARSLIKARLYSKKKKG